MNSNPMLRFYAACVFICCSLLTSVACPVRADDFSWSATAPSFGDFDTPSNWTPAVPPGIADTAIFNLGSASDTVYITTFASINMLQVDSGAVELAGLPLSVNSTTSPSISFGNSAGDVANVTLSCSLSSKSDAIGYAPLSQATTTLEGSWQDSNQYVGYAGTGTLNLVNAASVNTTSEVIGDQVGSQGTVTLTDSSSLTVTPPPANAASLVVGASGNGTLSVTGGATVTVSNQMVIAQNAMSQGIVTVGGRGASLDNAGTGNVQMTGVIVGMGGDGSLLINAGAHANLDGTIVIGQNAGSQGSISVADTTTSFELNETDAGVTVGTSGQGSFSVSSGASASMGGPIVIGRNAGAVGSFLVDGPGTSFDFQPGSNSSNSFIVGAAGRGSLSITGGAVANLGGTETVVGEGAGAAGTISVDGEASRLQLDGSTSLTLGEQGTGSLSLTNGGKVALPPQTTLGDAAGANGTISVDGGGSVLTSDGTTTIGNNGIGSLSITRTGTANLDGPVTVGQNNSAHGSVTVDGANSQLSVDSLTVGAFGAGTFSVSNGGEATTTSSGIILGQNQGASGTMTIDRANSKVSVGGAVVVGNSGTGALSITRGGSLSAPSEALDIAPGPLASATGAVNIDGVGSTMSIGSLNVGANGTGSMTVTGGAAVTINTDSFFVGPSAAGQTGQGSFSLDGAGTSLTVNGRTGNPSEINGALSITGGATLSTGNAQIGGSATAASVSVEGANSLWTADGLSLMGSNGNSSIATSLTIGSGASAALNYAYAIDGSTINLQGGTLTLSTLTGSMGLSIQASALIDNGIVQGNVEAVQGSLISGTGTITGALMAECTIAPGNSPGALTVGSLSLYDRSTFNFEINSATGTAGGTTGWNLLSSQGAASLDAIDGIATFNIALTSLTQNNTPGAISDFDPTKDYHWTFLTAGSPITGFDQATFVINTAGFANPIYGSFNVSEVGNSLVLNYTVPEPSSLVLASLCLLASLIYFRAGPQTIVDCD